MIPMTTQELGQQPGGARLGAFASRCRSHARAARSADRGNWRVDEVSPSHAATGVAYPAGNAAMGNAGTSGTTGLGFGLIKRSARPLRTRLT